MNSKLQISRRVFLCAVEWVGRRRRRRRRVCGNVMDGVGVGARAEGEVEKSRRMAE